MLKKLLIIVCVFSLSACAVKKNSATSSTESSGATEKLADSSAASLSPLVQAVDLIENNNSTEAKRILDEYVATRPENWAHRMADKKQVRVFFWDKEQLAECGLFEIVAAKGKKMEPILDASYSKAYYLLAFIALESRNNPYNTALMNLDKGLALEPDQPTLQYEKANLFYRLKRPEQAVEEYTRLTETTACLPNPMRARAYRGLGEALVSLGKYDDAEVVLYKSLKLDPSNSKSIAELEYIDKIRNLKITKQ